MTPKHRTRFFRSCTTSQLTCLIILFSFSYPPNLAAQSRHYQGPDNPFGFNFPDSLIRHRAYIATGSMATAYTGLMLFLETIWYRDRERVPFHFFNDNQGWMQIDKGGHAFSAYHQSFTAYNALRWAGYNHKTALAFGGPMGFILQMPVDIWDGLYEGHGFSWGDIVANTVGASLFTVQQALWQEQRIRIKFSYFPSDYREYNPPKLGKTHLESFFLDYNAHTYWLSASLGKLTGISSIPPWLCISLGYSANGMTDEFENITQYQGRPVPEFERYHQFLFSVDVDFSKIHFNSKFLRGVFFAVNMLKFPAPALEYNRIDGVRFRPLYY